RAKGLAVLVGLSAPRCAGPPWLVPGLLAPLAAASSTCLPPGAIMWRKPPDTSNGGILRLNILYGGCLRLCKPWGGVGANSHGYPWRADLNGEAAPCRRASEL